MMQLLEAIIDGTTDDAFQLYWTAEDKTTVMAHLKAIENFEFIYVLVTLQHSFMYFKEAAVKLQGVQQDLASGIALVENCSKELRRLWADVANYADRIFTIAAQQ